MDFIAFLFILAVVLFCFKGLGLILRTGIFLLSIPLIIAAVVTSVLIFALIPAAFITGLLALILAPIGLFAPVIPLLLIGLGIYLLFK
ncbi:MAG TPA: hypothetical protein ENN17_00945 [bacterium]|nr:hypothetical protein [bacterium]